MQHHTVDAFSVSEEPVVRNNQLEKQVLVLLGAEPIPFETLISQANAMGAFETLNQLIKDGKIVIASINGILMAKNAESSLKKEPQITPFGDLLREALE